MKTFKELNPIDFGLNSRVKIVDISKNSIGILKMRKSRIIMKDGAQILEIADQIKSVKKDVDISLIISGPICSKTTKYLNDNKIKIIDFNSYFPNN